MPRIFIASDHAGLSLKSFLLQNKSQFLSSDVQLEDLGPHDSTSVDYPDYADKLAKALLKAPKGSLGILVCGSGQGMCMRANRFSQIRAALCYDVVTSRLAREHNDANVLCLGGRLIPFGLALEISQTFFSTSFLGGRHQGRVDKISQQTD